MVVLAPPCAPKYQLELVALGSQKLAAAMLDSGSTGPASVEYHAASPHEPELC